MTSYRSIMLQTAVHLATHPRWTLRVMKGLQEYEENGGAFADMDYYLLTMGQVIWRHFQDIGARYDVILRLKVELPEGYIEHFRAWVVEYAAKNHSLTAEQRRQLGKIEYLDPEYLDFLADETIPKLRAEDVHVEDDGRIWLEGPELFVAFWEDAILAKFSALYFEMTGQHPVNNDWVVRAWDKGVKLKEAGIVFSEFGTRRRASFFVQFVALLMFIVSGAIKGKNDEGGLIGTSNVFLGLLLGIDLIGTMAHRNFMVTGAVYGYHRANRLVIKLWRKEFGDKLGYFLPDTYTTSQFLKDFDPEDAVIFTGARQDSGDAYEFVDKLIAYYKSIGFTPEMIAKKTIVFSDSLNVERAIALFKYARERGIRAAFGIGTNITNDVDGIIPLNIVFKATWAFLLSNPNVRRACVKISDAPIEAGKPNKVTGDEKTAGQIIHWIKTGEITWQKPLREHTPIPID